MFKFNIYKGNFNIYKGNFKQNTLSTCENLMLEESNHPESMILLLFGLYCLERLKNSKGDFPQIVIIECLNSTFIKEISTFIKEILNKIHFQLVKTLC